MEDKIIIQCDPDLEDLIPGYLNNRRNDIVKMKDLLQAEEFSGIRIIGHSMKGSGGGYGFDTVTDIGTAIENAALDQSAPELVKRILELENYLNQIEVVY